MGFCLIIGGSHRANLTASTLPLRLLTAHLVAANAEKLGPSRGLGLGLEPASNRWDNRDRVSVIHRGFKTLEVANVVVRDKDIDELV